MIEINKRTIFTLLGITILSMLVIFSGCASETLGDEDTPKERILIKEEENEGKDKYKVKLIIKDDDTLIYEMSTEGDTNLQAGRNFTVEKLNDNDQWEMLDLNLNFTMDLVIISSDSPFSQEIDISELEAGNYRVTKSLLDSEGQVIENFGTIEFEILD